MITVSVTFAKVVVLDGRVKHDALHGEVDLAHVCRWNVSGLPP